jgi:hypothetical protein
LCPRISDKRIKSGLLDLMVKLFEEQVLSTSAGKFAPTLSNGVEVYLGQEVRDAWTKAQVPNRVNN